MSYTVGRQSIIHRGQEEFLYFSPFDVKWIETLYHFHFLQLSLPLFHTHTHFSIAVTDSCVTQPPWHISWSMGRRQRLVSKGTRGNIMNVNIVMVYINIKCLHCHCISHCSVPVISHCVCVSSRCNSLLQGKTLANYFLFFFSGLQPNELEQTGCTVKMTNWQ